MRNARYVRLDSSCRISINKGQQWQLADMQRELDKLSNQARFVQMIIDNKLTISKKKKSALMTELKKLGFKAYEKMEDAKKAGEEQEAVEESDNEENAAIGAHDYDYLLGV
jgi:DNA topoisomerase II